MISKGVAECGTVYAYTPYTEGTENEYVQLACHVLADFRASDQGKYEADRAAHSLRMCMNHAKYVLQAHDIERVMWTVRSLLKDAMWDKAKARFLKFIYEDYCSDFFNKVCRPVVQVYGTLLEDDLFTGFQYVSARANAISSTIKDIVTKGGINSAELLDGRCFLQYFVNEQIYNTVESFLHGHITASFCSIYAYTQYT